MKICSFFHHLKLLLFLGIQIPQTTSILKEGIYSCNRTIKPGGEIFLVIFESKDCMADSCIVDSTSRCRCYYIKQETQGSQSTALKK